MFVEMRRKDRQANSNTIDRLLRESEYGVLSTYGSNNYPYSTALNFVYHNKKIYFHCATEGQKLDNIKYNNNICFSIIGDTKLLPESFSASYESVIVFGKAHIVSDNMEKDEALRVLIYKYSPNFVTEGMQYINRAKNSTTIVRIDIEKVTGKNR